MPESIRSIGYSPGPAPSGAALPGYTESELRRVAAVLNLLAAGHIPPTFTEPKRPRDGDIRLADGTYWNPGSGQGPYMYYGGAWNFLGAVSTAFRAPIATSAPASPQAGDIVFASGWDPGSGNGFYGYDGTTWKFLG